MGITLKMRREMVQVERDVMKGLREDLRKIRAAMNQSRLNIKMHQEVLADERKFARLVKEEQRHLRARKQAAAMHARIEKMEAKLAALKVKAAA
jgi:BMFP domain-containing protein YqiC